MTGASTRRHLVVVTLFLLSLVAVGPLQTVPAQGETSATGGSGRYVDRILWLTWGDGRSGTADQALPAGSASVVTQMIAGQKLVTTCTLGEAVEMQGVDAAAPGAELFSYRPGSYVADGFDDLYNIGGTAERNSLVAGIRQGNGQSVRFDATCGATLDGEPYDLPGIVVADAESSGTLGGISPGEYVSVTGEGSWALIERYRDQCSLSYTAVRSVAPAGQTLLMTGVTPAPELQCAVAPMALGHLSFSATAYQGTQREVRLGVALQGGGNSAVALGVMVPYDAESAPESYGSAAHLVPTTFDSNLATGRNDVFAAGQTLAQPVPAMPRLGTTLSEDGVTLPATFTTGETVDIPVNVRGRGRLSVWFDWNRDGDFLDKGEQVAANRTTAADTSVLSVKVPARATPGTSYARFRLCSGDQDCDSPTGVASDGEVEDYAATLAPPPPSLTLVAHTQSVRDKNQDGFTAAGDTVKMRFRVTNTGGVGLRNVGVEMERGGDAVCAPAVLAPGGQADCATKKAMVIAQTDVDHNGGVIRTAATASASAPDGVPVESTAATVVIKTDQTANLTVAGKVAAVSDQDKNGTTDSGDLVSYSWKLRNTGSLTVSNVAVSDDQQDVISCGRKTLSPGQTTSCPPLDPYRVTSKDAAAGVVANQAQVIGKTLAGAVVEASDVVTVVVGAPPPIGAQPTPEPNATPGAAPPPAPGSGEVSAPPAPSTSSEPSSSATGQPDVPGVPSPSASIEPGSTGSEDPGAGVEDPEAGADPSAGPSAKPPVVKPGGARAINLVARTPRSVDLNGNAVVDAGDTIRYSYTLRNLTGKTMRQVTVRDSNAGRIPCQVSTLAVGASTTCTAKGSYSITQTDVDSGVVRSSAVARGEVDKQGMVQTSVASPPLPVDQVASLSLDTNTLNSEDVNADGITNAGDLVGYQVGVTNAGTVTMTGVTVRSSQVNTFTCDSSTVAPGQTLNCVSAKPYEITVADVAAGSVVNTVSARGKPPATVSCANSACVAGPDSTSLRTNETRPGVSVVTTPLLKDLDGEGKAGVDEQLDVYYLVTNTGPTELVNLVVNDEMLPAAGAASCPRTSLAPSESMTCQASYTVVDTDLKKPVLTSSAVVSGVTTTGETVESKAPLRRTPTDQTWLTSVKPGSGSVRARSVSLAVGLVALASATMLLLGYRLRTKS